MRTYTFVLYSCILAIWMFGVWLFNKAPYERAENRFCFDLGFVVGLLVFSFACH